MNPVNRFNIANYKETLRDIEKLGQLEYLRDLENKVISEIVRLVADGSDEARLELHKLEKSLDEELNYKPKSPFLISALKKSIKGALSAAKFCMF